jgi:hypothetical protein
MSWHILLMRSDFPSMGEFPDDYTPPPLGEGELVRGRVKVGVASAEFHEPTWAQVQGDGWRVDITIGSEEPVESILLHVEGGPEALKTVRVLADAVHAKALDCSTGKFIDFSNPPPGHAIPEGKGEPSTCP